MIKYATAIFCVSMGLHASAAKLEFIDAKFDDFMERVHVPAADRESFKSYYARVFTLLKESEEQPKRAAQGYLYNQALAALEKDHPEWHKALKPFISDPRITLDPELNDVRTFIGGFLLRYGAYQEYCVKKVAGKRSHPSEADASLWGSIKSCANGAYSTVAHWCGSVKNYLTT